MRTCPNCGTGINLNARFCNYCGNALVCPEILEVCQKCEAFMIPGANFCDQCGTATPLIPVIKQTGTVKYQIFIQPEWINKPRDEYHDGQPEPVATLEEVKAALEQYYPVKRSYRLWLGEFVE